MRVSEHFTYAEAVKSSIALRREILNVPTEDEVVKICICAEQILEPPRMHFMIPFAPSSWFRCIELNRALLSKDSSKHVLAEAVDFEIPGVDNLVLAHWLQDNLESFDQIILEFYDGRDPASGWVHGSFADLRDNRKEVITYYLGGRVLYGLPPMGS